MTEEREDFQRIMAGLGVKPIDREQTGRPKDDRALDAFRARFQPNDEMRDQEDGELFRQSVREIETAPDKDGEASRRQVGPRYKVRPDKRAPIDPEESLDLHGMTVEEALDALARFVARAFAHSARSVVVITGKGKHSARGASVLRPAVERWIVQKGRRFIRAYAEAPRAFGGRGAFVLYLKPS